MCVCVNAKGKRKHRGPRYLPTQCLLSKCLFWIGLAANWLQLTLYWDELESEHETFPSGRKKKRGGGGRTNTYHTCTHAHTHSRSSDKLARVHVQTET